MGIGFVVRHGHHHEGTLSAIGEQQAEAAAAHIRAAIAQNGFHGHPRVIRTSHEQRARAFGQRIGAALDAHACEEWDPLIPADRVSPPDRKRNIAVVAEYLRNRIETADGIPILVTHAPNIALLIHALAGSAPSDIPNGMIAICARTPDGLRITYFTPPQCDE